MERRLSEAETREQRLEVRPRRQSTISIPEPTANPIDQDTSLEIRPDDPLYVAPRETQANARLNIRHVARQHSQTLARTLEYLHIRTSRSTESKAARRKSALSKLTTKDIGSPQPSNTLLSNMRQVGLADQPTISPTSNRPASSLAGRASPNVNESFRGQSRKGLGNFSTVSAPKRPAAHKRSSSWLLLNRSSSTLDILKASKGQDAENQSSAEGKQETTAVARDSGVAEAPRDAKSPVSAGDDSSQITIVKIEPREQSLQAPNDLAGAPQELETPRLETQTEQSDPSSTLDASADAPDIEKARPLIDNAPTTSIEPRPSQPHGPHSTETPSTSDTSTQESDDAAANTHAHNAAALRSHPVRPMPPRKSSRRPFILRSRRDRERHPGGVTAELDARIKPLVSDEMMDRLLVLNAQLLRLREVGVPNLVKVEEIIDSGGKSYVPFGRCLHSYYPWFQSVGGVKSG